MFENVGEKLKMLAKVCFGILCACSVIGAIAIWSIEHYSRYGDYTHPYIWQGMAVLIGGILLAWLSTIGLYAFGELVENSEERVRQNREIISLLKSKDKDKESISGIGAAYLGNTEPSRVTFYPTSSASSAVTQLWTCKCGTENPVGTLFCQNCGKMPD